MKQKLGREENAVSVEIFPQGKNPFPYEKFESDNPR